MRHSADNDPTKKDHGQIANVEVYATECCPYCKRARKLLEANGANYELIDVMLDPRRQKAMMAR